MHFLWILLIREGTSYDQVWNFFGNVRIFSLLSMTAFSFIGFASKKMEFNTKTYYIFPFIGIAFLSLTASPMLSTAFQRTLSYLLIVFVVWNYIAHELKRTKGEFILDIIYFASWVYLFGFIRALVFPEAAFFGGRFQGTFSNPNGVGLFSLVVFPLYFYYFKTHPNFPKLKKWVVFGLMGLSLLLCGSRTSIGTILMFLGLYHLFTRPRYLQAYLFSFVVLPIAILLSTVSIVDIITAVGLGEQLRAETLLDASGRTWSWKFALTHIPNRLWIGGGFFFEQYLYAKFVPPELDVYRAFQAVWNSYLSILLNNGVLGLITYLYFLFANYRDTTTKRFAKPFFICMLVACFFESWLTSSINSYTIYFFITLILYQQNPFPYTLKRDRQRLET